MIVSNKLTDTWLPELPSIYQIEVMSRCNLKCNFCMTGQLWGEAQTEAASINPELFYTIVERDLGGSNFIELQFRGEPTLNKYLHNYVRALRDKVFVGFSTHGGLLHRPYAMDAAWSSHYVTVSLDAGEKEVHEKYRIGSTWECVIANINQLLAIKGSDKFPIIDLQIIEFEGFEEQVEKLQTLADKSGWFISAGNTLRIRTVKDTQAAWTQNYQHQMEELSLCTNPWYSVSIKANGDVVPCCMAFPDLPEMTYGNLNESSLKEIWQSDQVKEFRRLHQTDQLPEFCQQCYARSPHNLHQKLSHEIIQLTVLNSG
jgi:radical SAM protein with 4Fe4S-binding SPASM domain